MFMSKLMSSLIGVFVLALFSYAGALSDEECWLTVDEDIDPSGYLVGVSNWNGACQCKEKAHAYNYYTGCTLTKREGWVLDENGVAQCPPGAEEWDALYGNKLPFTRPACRCNSKEGFEPTCSGYDCTSNNPYGCKCKNPDMVIDAAGKCKCDAARNFVDDDEGGCKCDDAQNLVSDGEGGCKCRNELDDDGLCCPNPLSIVLSAECLSGCPASHLTSENLIKPNWGVYPPNGVWAYEPVDGAFREQGKAFMYLQYEDGIQRWDDNRDYIGGFKGATRYTYKKRACAIGAWWYTATESFKNPKGIEDGAATRAIVQFGNDTPLKSGGDTVQTQGNLLKPFDTIFSNCRNPEEKFTCTMTNVNYDRVCQCKCPSGSNCELCESDEFKNPITKQCESSTCNSNDKIFDYTKVENRMCPTGYGISNPYENVTLEECKNWCDNAIFPGDGLESCIGISFGGQCDGNKCKCYGCQHATNLVNGGAADTTEFQVDSQYDSYVLPKKCQCDPAKLLESDGSEGCQCIQNAEETSSGCQCVTGYTYDDVASMCKPVPYVEDARQTDKQNAIDKIAHYSSLRRGTIQKRSDETSSAFTVRKFKEMKVITQNYFVEQMAAKHEENNALPTADKKTAHELRKELRMPLSIADNANDFKATLKTKLQTLFGADRDVGIIVGPVKDESSERCADYVPAATFDDDDDCITYDAAIENDKTDVHVLGSDNSYNVGGILLGGVYVPVVKQKMEDAITETFRMQCWDITLKQWDTGQVLSSGEEIVCAVRVGDAKKSVKTIVGSSVSGSVEEALFVTYSMSLDNTYELCEGDTTKYIEVVKNGNSHNVYEVGVSAAVYESFNIEDVPDTEHKLSAPQGTAREFYCSYHPKNRFTVYCRGNNGSCPDGYEETSDRKCVMSDARLMQHLQCKDEHLPYYASNTPAPRLQLPWNDVDAVGAQLLKLRSC